MKGIRQLWAPWRMAFVEGGPSDGSTCVFCEKFADHNDEGNYILFKNETIAALLNIYPYNNGHTLVMPLRHAGSLEELTDKELTGLMKGVIRVKSALDRAFAPSGYNVGMNLGICAGAGIPDHVHVHVVPRWEGDTNFMPVIAGTKVMPQHLAKTFSTIKEAIG